MKLELHLMVELFATKWGPDEAGPRWDAFLGDLRVLLEAYGAAALFHESLPDTEHAHGDPL
jgi:hypothetical protein